MNIPVGSENYMPSALLVMFYVIKRIVGFTHFPFGLFLSVDLAVSEMNMLQSLPTIVDLAIYLFCFFSNLKNMYISGLYAYIYS